MAGWDIRYPPSPDEELGRWVLGEAPQLQSLRAGLQRAVLGRADADNREDLAERLVIVATIFPVGTTTPDGVRSRTAYVDLDLGDVERASIVGHSRPPGQERPLYGGVELTIDTDHDVIIGATCVGPEADSWGAELALAIRAQVRLPVLRDHLRAFPTWSEIITATLD